jgi:hypothetical protein
MYLQILPQGPYGAWKLSPEPVAVPLPVALFDTVLVSPAVLQAADMTSEIVVQMQVNPQQIEQVAALTAGQRSNHHWGMYRRGRLTASNFGAVLQACSRKSYPPSLFKKLFGGYNLDKVQAVQWGIQNEETAVKLFVESTGMPVKPTGIWLHQSGVIGASPDGLVGDDSLVEIKCPFSKRLDTIEEAVADRTFYVQMLDESYILKEDHPYYHQVQGALHLTNRETAYFCVWTTKSFLILPIQKDVEWANENLNILQKFYKEQMLPRLLE